ncbi:histidine kinase [Haloferula sp. BvORR071]|uniref:histidine kinase n=1 Tax=Haloferula sp. BvORR071 TaxID=1396141 RepID=UPI0006969C6F|nr:histidine kinase [Haloferula sp. BvORR071]
MKMQAPPILHGYLAALRRHIEHASGRGRQAAQKLGLLALKRGLSTPGVAQVHQRSLVSLGLIRYPEDIAAGVIQRAADFFTATVTPIEEAQYGLVEANARLQAAVETLSQRSDELRAANEELRQEIARRKEVESSLRTSELTSSQLLAKSREMQEELRYLSRRLIAAQEEERKRISRELHDVIAQTLTGINVRLSTLKLQTTANAKDFQKKIAFTQRLLEKSMGVVHRFAFDLRPTVLDDLGLVPALRSYIKAFISRTGIHVDFTAATGVEKLANAELTVLYRIAQEGLANIARHARASRAEIAISIHAGGVRMEITDNERGFRLDSTAKSGRRERLGILGMRERVEMIGGSFHVESAVTKGTMLRVDLPQAAGAK